jgi:uncharacterized protein involved in response to NO
VRAHFRFPCARARSDQVQNLHSILKLAVLHFLFSSLLSQTAPSVSFLVSQKEFYGWRQKKQVSMKLIATLAPAQAEIDAGVVAKADQYKLFGQKMCP